MGDTESIPSTPGGVRVRSSELGAGPRMVTWAAFVMAGAGTVSVLIQTWFVKTMPCDLDGDRVVTASEAAEVNNSALRSLAGVTLWLLVPLLLAIPTGVIAAGWRRRWWPLLSSAMAVLAVIFLLNVTFADNPGYSYYFCGD